MSFNKEKYIPLIDRKVVVPGDLHLYMCKTLGDMQGLFNNPNSFPDFFIQETSSSKKLCLHKCILYKNPYFKTFFSTSVGNVNNILKVENLKIPAMLVKFIYDNQYFFSLGTLNSDEFVEFVSLANEWMMPEGVMDYVFEYLLGGWRKLVEENIGVIPWLEKFFGQYKIPPFDYFNGEYYTDCWSGKYMLDKLAYYLSDIKDEITAEMVEWESFKIMNSYYKLLVYMRLGMYDKILTVDTANLQHLPRLFKEHSPKEGIFTAKQLSILRSSKNITKQDIEDVKSGKEKALQIFSLVPFKACIHTCVGKTIGKSKKFKSILVKMHEDLTKADIILISGKKYTISSFYVENENREEVFAFEEVSISVKSIESPEKEIDYPNNGTFIYKVVDV